MGRLLVLRNFLELLDNGEVQQAFNHLTSRMKPYEKVLNMNHSSMRWLGVGLQTVRAGTRNLGEGLCLRFT